jgi:hypothetical protein
MTDMAKLEAQLKRSGLGGLGEPPTLKPPVGRRVGVWAKKLVMTRYVATGDRKGGLSYKEARAMMNDLSDTEKELRQTLKFADTVCFAAVAAAIGVASVLLWKSKKRSQ